MKKFSVYLLAFVLSALFFTACNNDDDSPSGPGTFTSIIVDGKGVSNNDNIPLNKSAFNFSWVIDKGSSDIKSLKIEVNNQIVTDGNGIVWNGTSIGSQTIKGQAEQWVNTITLSVPNDNLLGLYNYVLTLTNAAGEKATFKFTISYNDPAFPGEPTLAIKLDDKVAYNGIKYAVGTDLFILDWYAIKGLEDLQSIMIEHNGNPVVDLDGVYWDGQSIDSNATEEQLETWKNSIKIPFEVGLYKITVIDAIGLSKSVEFEITRKTDNDLYGLAGSEWELTACNATILTKTFTIDENAQEVILSQNVVMPDDEAIWEEQEMLLPHDIKFERMNAVFNYKIDNVTRNGLYSFTSDGKVITCTFDDNGERFIFTRNGNKLTREVDILDQMPAPQLIDPNEPESPLLIYTKAKLTYTYTKK